MARSIGSGLLLHLIFLSLLIFSLNDGGSCKVLEGRTHEKQWCVPKASASDEDMQMNIEYCCNILGDFCRTIQPGGECYYPNTVLYHASVVMNQYYFSAGSNYWNCDFRGSGALVVTDPSHGDCQFNSGGSDPRRSLFKFIVSSLVTVFFWVICVVV